MSALKPDTDDKHTLGTSDLKWKELHVHDIELKSSLKLEGSSSGVSTLATLAAAADTTINLPAMAAGTYHLPVLAAASTTAIAATPEELNLLDAGTAGASVELATADSLIIGDASDTNTSKKVLLSDVITLLQDGTSGLNSFGRAVSISDATVSTSTTTGALKVTGGAGIAKELFVGLKAEIGGITTLKSTLKLNKAASGTGIIFNADRAAGDSKNGTDFDAVLVHVDDGGSDSVDAYLKWDDDQDSFLVSGGKLHSETRFSVGGTLGSSTPTLVVTPTTGVIDVEGSAPVLTIKNTANDAVGGVLKLVNDKGAAGADNDVAGAIEFHANDDAQDQVKFAEIKAQVSDASNSFEGGKLTLSVASHDGGLASGIVINGGTQITDATCDTTENSTTVTMDSTANLHVGMGVIGTGIPALATVASINANGTEFTLSAQATESNTDETLTFINADDEVDVTIGNGSNSTVTIPGNLTVQGTTVTVDTTNLSVSDQNILINDGGSLANSALAGLDIEADGAVVGFMRAASSHANLEFKAPSGSTLTLDVNANKTLTVAGDLTVETGTSVINQDLSSDSTTAAFNTLTINTSLLPDASGGADIGSATLEFGDIFVGNGKGLKLGADQDVTILHDSAVGLAIESTGDIGISSNAGSINLGADLLDGQTLKLGKESTVQTIIAPSNTAGSELYSVINTAGDTTGSDGAGAILLSSVAGGMGLAWNAAKALHAQGGTAVIAAEENVRNAIKLHATAGAAQTIRLENTAGTEDAAATFTDATCDTTNNDATVTMNSTANILAGMPVSGTGIPSGAFVASITNSTTFELSVNATATNTDETLTFTKSAAIDLTSFAGGVSIAAPQGKDVKISGGQVALESKANADSTGLASAISLTTPAGALGGAADTIVITNTQGTVDGSDDAGAIELSAAAGGIGLAWADNKDLWAEGGRAIITANENPGSAGPVIKLHADAGVNQTIQLVNDQGTDAAAIDLTASAGGISLTSASTVTVDSDAFDITSNQANDPLVRIVNTANDEFGARLRFVKVKGAAGDEDDVAGLIEFYADDDAQDQVKFGEIKSQIADASNGAEGGRLTFSVASHDGGLASGLILADGSADDEVDVTIGNGAASLTTVAGELAVTGNLTVNGTTTTVNSTTLTVDDKNIELGVSGDDITGQTATLDNTVATVTVTSTAGYRVGATLTKTAGGGAFKAGGVRIKSVDSSTQITVENNDGDAVHATSGAVTFTVDNSDATDFTADGGGITLKATQDKTFNYVKSTDSWTSSENLDLANGKEIKHNGTALLSSSTLANSITSLAGITVAQAGGTATLGSGGAIGADFGAIDNGTSNITTGGLLKIDVDGTILSGTAIGQAGSLTLGEGAAAGLYVASDDLIIENVADAKDILIKAKNSSSRTVIFHDADEGETKVRSKFTLTTNADIDNASNNVIEMVGKPDADEVSLDVKTGQIKTSQANAGINIAKGATSGDAGSNNAPLATIKSRAFVLTLTTGANIADNAHSTGFRVDNDEVSTSSVIMGTVASALDGPGGSSILADGGIEVYAHTLTDNRFFFSLVNRTGQQIDADSVIAINFVML